MTFSPLWSSLYLGPGSLKGKPARDTVYGRRWAALSFQHSSKARWPAGATVVHALRLRAWTLTAFGLSSHSDLILPYWIELGSHFTSPCFFFYVLGNTLKSPLLCSISSHYRTYHVTIYSFVCHFFHLFLPQECKHNARIFV